MEKRTCVLVAAVVWAAFVGISVPLEVCNTSLLNSNASPDDRSFHGFYISVLAVITGGAELAPLSFGLGPRWSKPTRFWSLLGGVCSLPAFITISAAPIIGAQLLLMVQLVGVLGTFAVLDIFARELRLRDWQKSLGFVIAVIGVCVDNVKAFENKASINAGWIFHFVGVFVSGIGYGLQAKCNGQLAQDIGGPARAAMISALVNVIFGLPLLLYIYFGRHIAISLDTQLWPLWLVAGFQSAFYIGSMACLPKLLGFTRCYLLVLASKLVCSSVVDAYGLAGKLVPFSTTRAISLLLVFVGAGLFNLRSGKTSLETESEQMINASNSARKLGNPGTAVSIKDDM